MKSVSCFTPELSAVCVCVFQDISAVYQIFTDEVLGSGQFGVVYKGGILMGFFFSQQ